jgi:hypothetical protein
MEKEAAVRGIKGGERRRNEYERRLRPKKRKKAEDIGVNGRKD